MRERERERERAKTENDRCCTFHFMYDESLLLYVYAQLEIGFLHPKLFKLIFCLSKNHGFAEVSLNHFTTTVPCCLWKAVEKIERWVCIYNTISVCNTKNVKLSFKDKAPLFFTMFLMYQNCRIFQNNISPIILVLK